MEINTDFWLGILVAVLVFIITKCLETYIIKPHDQLDVLKSRIFVIFMKSRNKNLDTIQQILIDISEELRSVAGELQYLSCKKSLVNQAPSLKIASELVIIYSNCFYSKPEEAETLRKKIARTLNIEDFN